MGRGVEGPGFNGGWTGTGGEGERIDRAVDKRLQRCPVWKHDTGWVRRSKRRSIGRRWRCCFAWRIQSHRRTTRDGQPPADERRRCAGVKRLRPGRGHEGKDLGAASRGAERAGIGRRLGLGRNTISLCLKRLGGIRPRPRRCSERCLTLEEREEISRGIARGHSAREIARTLGRFHTTIAREISRCGGHTVTTLREPPRCATRASSASRRRGTPRGRPSKRRLRVDGRLLP